MGPGKLLQQRCTGWVGDNHSRQMLCAGAELIAPDSSPISGSPLTRLVVEANAGPRRAARSGLFWLQHLRRTTRTLAPALVYSFETREALAKQFSMLAPGMPGIGFIRAPFTRAEFEAELAKLEPLTQDQLQYLLRWHCGLQEEWQAKAHELGHALSDWPAQRDRARKIVAEWAVSVRDIAPDQEDELARLEQAMDGGLEDVRRAKDVLDRGLNVRPGLEASEDEPLAAPEARPPRGCEAVLLADDGPDAESLADRLREMRYTVEVAQSLEEARCLLDLWSPGVVLADLNFPTKGDGQALMGEALSVGAVVIGISKACALAGDLPPGVADCCGSYCADVGRMHRIIWRDAVARRDRWQR